MKRIALVLCATASLFSGVSAMDSAQQESVDICSEYSVNTVPPIGVQIRHDAFFDSINKKAPRILIAIDAEHFIERDSIDLVEGFELKSPLKLDYKMTKEQVISALFSAFGDDKEIKYETFRVYGDCIGKVEEIFTKNH